MKKALAILAVVAAGLPLYTGFSFFITMLQTDLIRLFTSKMSMYRLTEMVNILARAVLSIH